jgi:hypothetical protein
LRGEWRHGGWWYYYLYAMAIKIPMGTWLLLAMTLIGSAWLRSWRPEEWLLVAPAAALIAFVSSQTGFNHHLRYVLPAFPFLFVLASKAFWLARDTRWATGLSSAALAWTIASSLAIYPRGTSYFNEIVGGPANGHRHLHFSNVDWGQDLTLVKRWVDEHPKARPVSIQAFNVVGSEVLGVDYSTPNLWPPAKASRGKPLEELGPRPGWYIVSVNYVQGYSDHSGSHWGRPAQDYANDPSLRYFKEFVPVDRIGYTMLVYQVELSECNRVRELLGLPRLLRP